MNRDIVWALVGIGAACWAIGGGGPKWVRRYLWPVVACATTLWFTHRWVASFLGLLSMSVFLHLGYGDDVKFVRRVGVFLGYGISLIPFGVGWWSSIVIAGILTGLFSLSRRVNEFTWKWWELSAGALQGFAIASAILRQ